MSSLSIRNTTLEFFLKKEFDIHHAVIIASFGENIDEQETGHTWPSMRRKVYAASSYCCGKTHARSLNALSKDEIVTKHERSYTMLEMARHRNHFENVVVVDRRLVLHDAPECTFGLLAKLFLERLRKP
jgi:hypothetical protein